MRYAFVCRAGLILLAVVLGALPATAAPAPSSSTETLPEKDRGSFIPRLQFKPLPGRVKGLLLSNVAETMGQEGRSGPPDAMAFSMDGSSYYWVYVTAEGAPRITNLRVRVGEKGDEVKIYPALDMASPTTVKRWGITVPYALVEVEVNDGLGAPADQAFVATSMKRLDDTAAYPLKVEKVLNELKRKGPRYFAKEEKSIETAFKEAQKTILKDDKYTGPRGTQTLHYFTWLAKEQRLEARFLQRITDGAYKYVEVEGPGLRPVPLPLPPGRGFKAPPPAAAFPPPPPPPLIRRLQYGKSVTVELGVALQANKSGRVDKTILVPIKTSSSEQPMPPALPPGRIGRPRLPVKP